jgi:membrane protein
MGDDVVGKLKRIQNATQDFLEEKGIESADQYDSSRLWRLAHFCLLVGKNFWRNRCPVRASALAYTTLLALIPVLAIAVSITTSLLQNQGDKPIRQFIDYLVANAAPALSLEVSTNKEAAQSKRDEVVATITRFVSNIRSGTLGVTGGIALVFVAISLLRTIEAAFNDIWGVTRGRSWLRSSVQYWAAITLGPVILALAIGLTSSPHFEQTARVVSQLGWAGVFFLQLLPFLVVSLAFALFYQLMPNTRVHWPAALVGGLVGGCLWQLNNLFNVLYVSQVVSYSQIYGGLAMIPLFLIGLYFSWLIVLFGAQVAYAFQNRVAYLQEKVAENVNQAGREFVALRVMALVAHHFLHGRKAPGANQAAAALGVPSRLVAQILQAMQLKHLVVEVQDNGFVPARPPEQITAHEITQALRGGQGLLPATREDALREPVRQEFDRIRQAEATAASAVTLRDLAQGGAAPGGNTARPALPD